MFLILLVRVGAWGVRLVLRGRYVILDFALSSCSSVETETFAIDLLWPKTPPRRSLRPDLGLRETLEKLELLLKWSLSLLRLFFQQVWLFVCTSSTKCCARDIINVAVLALDPL